MARLLSLVLCAVGVVGVSPVEATGLPIVSIDRAVGTSERSTALVVDAKPTVVLPDDWSESHPGLKGVVWYRSTFELGSVVPTEPLAVYIGRGCTSLEVRLNLGLVVSDNASDGPTLVNCSHPRLLTLPASGLRPGENSLDIGVEGNAQNRVASVQAGAGLSAIEVGTESELATAHAFELMVAPVWTEACNVMLVGVGFVLLTMGWLSRREPHVSYLGLLCLGWVAVSFGLWVRDLPWSEEANEFVLACSWSVLLAFAVQFSLCCAHLRSRRIEQVLAWQFVLMPLSLWVGGPDRLFETARIWYVLFAIELAWAQWVLLSTTGRERPRSLRVLALIASGIAFCTLLELAVQTKLLPAPAFSEAQLVAPLLILALGIRLILKFNRSLRSIEVDRNQLILQLQSIAVDVESRVERLAQERSIVLRETERKRIASDLHDDLGAKLLTIVHTSDITSIPDLAREALEEMRLSVRGLTGKPVDLADALADWRAEIMNRLGQAQIVGLWEDRSAGVAHVLPARVFMQLTRILREAVSNVIKHSAASRCKVRWDIDQDTLRLAVRDDGRGISNDEMRRGQGMSSMKIRAKRLNGQCLVESRQGSGVEVSLTIPLT